MIVAFIRFDKYYKIIAILGALIFVYLIPENILHVLQNLRNDGNIFRILLHEEGIRSAFLNPFYQDGVIYFIANYLYAFVRLHFSPFFSFSIRELFLFSNICAYGFLLYKGAKFINYKQNPEILLCFALLMSHILTSILFEPDLGSYFRHSCSLIIYFLPIMKMIENKKIKP